MTPKKCNVCGTDFYSNNARARYCSASCKTAGRQEKRKKWEQANPDYMKNYMRDRRAEKHEIPG